MFIPNKGVGCFFDAFYNPVYESLERGDGNHRYFKGYNDIFKYINAKLPKSDPNMSYDYYQISKDQIHTDIESYESDKYSSI